MLRNLLSRMDSIFSRIIWGFLLFVKKDKIFKLTLFALEFHSSKVKNAVQLSLKMTLNSCSTFASKCIKLKIGPSRVKVQDFSCLEVEGNSGVTLAIFSAVKRKRIWVSLLALGLRWHKSLVGLLLTIQLQSGMTHLIFRHFYIAANFTTTWLKIFFGSWSLEIN